MKNEIENKLTKLFAELITSLGEDIHRNVLVDNPQRAADAFRFLTQVYGMDIHSVVNGALFNCDNKEMVVVKNIELFSVCEHHLLPIIGRCHIGYIPSGKIIGLSKIARRNRSTG